MIYIYWWGRRVVSEIVVVIATVVLSQGVIYRGGSMGGKIVHYIEALLGMKILNFIAYSLICCLCGLGQVTCLNSTFLSPRVLGIVICSDTLLMNGAI